MVAETSFRRWAFIMTAGLAATSVANSSDRAFEKLSVSLKRTCDYNVCALIDQRDPFTSGLQRVKVLRDGRGRFRKSVLQPLRMQGVESVDDGNRWLTVWPDDGKVVDQESPLRRPSDDALRMRLAKRNYEFRIEGKGEVAGREVTRILATPFHEKLDERRYFLDARTLYPLKVESIRGSRTILEFITVDVSYPKHLDSSTFKLSPDPNLRRETFERPESVLSVESAQRQLGFMPILPSDLPLGFETQEMQIRDDPSWRALIVRLTDGLVRATVYEYMDAEAGVGVRALDTSSSRLTDGIRVLLVSGLSEDVRATLLQRFVDSRSSAFERPSDPPQQQFGPKRELPCTVGTLATLEPRPQEFRSNRTTGGRFATAGSFWTCTLKPDTHFESDPAMR